MNERISLTVSSVELETTDTITITFEKPNNFIYEAGQFLTLIITIDGQEYRRSYSFSSCPVTDINPSITVKKIDGGLISTYLYTKVYVGMQLSSLAPSGNFKANSNANQNREVVLIAAGSGITPLYAIAKNILKIEKQTKISLLFANKNEGSIIFRNKITQLEHQFPNRFNCIHTLSKPLHSWTGFTSKINQYNIVKYLDEFNLTDLHKVDFYLCGPELLMQNITTGLTEEGVKIDQIKKEKFSTSITSLPEHNIPHNHYSKVTARIKNTDYTFEVIPNQTILSAAKLAGVRLPYSCENGVCTACMVTCTKGSVDMKNNDTLSINEKAQGYVLTCCGYANSTEITLIAD